MLKRTAFTALAAAAVSTSALVVPAMLTPAAAQASLNVVIGTPPPAPVYEVVPAPRARLRLGAGLLSLGGRPSRLDVGPLDGRACRLSLGPRPLGSRLEWLVPRGRPVGPQRQRHSRPLRASRRQPAGGATAITTAFPMRYDNRPSNPYRR